MTTASATRADICCVAVAECFRGDGEIVANPIGTIPRIGGLLARLSFEPDLVMTDGEAMLTDADGHVEAWNPYRSMFDVVWSGRRHVIMGGSQLDPHGNHNFAAIGDMKRPKAQLLGFRGAPGNTVNNVTSYWVPNHGPRVFVAKVDVVTGVGYDRAAAAGPAATTLPRAATRRHEPLRPRLRDARPPDAAAVGAPGRHGRRRRRGDRLRARRFPMTCRPRESRRLRSWR